MHFHITIQIHTYYISVHYHAQHVFSIFHQFLLLYPASHPTLSHSYYTNPRPDITYLYYIICYLSFSCLFLYHNGSQSCKFPPSGYQFRPFRLAYFGPQASLDASLTRIPHSKSLYNYSLMDASETYRIAMGESLFYDCSIADHCLISVLHPRYKLTYFKSAGWRDSWISTAEKLVRNRFSTNHAAAKAEQEEADGNGSDDSVHEVCEQVTKAGFHLTMLEQATSQGNIFDNLPSLAPLKSTPVVDEITLYLTVPLENVKDAIKWWREKHNVYPRLSRMALDYLTIPGMQCLACVFNLLTKSTATSIDVERLFSRGRLILSHTCSRLSVSSTRALLSWIMEFDGISEE
jgi:hypothetical protein